MPLCGFNAKMVQGISIFAEGLFEATMERASLEKLDLPTAFRKELSDICVFLEGLEAKHQSVKYRLSQRGAMREVVNWIVAHDTRPKRKNRAKPAIKKKKSRSVK